VAEPRGAFDEGAEPSVLGASATLPVGRGSGREMARAARQRGNLPPQPDGPAAPTTAPPRRRERVERVWEPGSSGVLPLGEYVRELWVRRPFIAEMARAELRGSRASTALGALWGVADPLIQAGIYFFLFTVIRGASGRPDGFLPVLVAGVLLFSFVRAAMMGGGRAVLNGKNLILNSSFPRAVLPVAALYRGLLEFIPAVGVYAVIHVVAGAPVHRGLLLIPVLFTIQLVMSLGLALLLATLNVFFRDMVNFTSYLLRILMFASPIIFPVSFLAQRQVLGIGLDDILLWQPLFPLFASYQAVLLGGAPEPLHLVLTVVWAVVFLVLGVWQFRKRERTFAVRL
jgi:teichoic acid transport system permease protein